MTEKNRVLYTSIRCVKRGCLVHSSLVHLGHSTHQTRQEPLHWLKTCYIWWFYCFYLFQDLGHGKHWLGYMVCSVSTIPLQCRQDFLIHPFMCKHQRERVFVQKLRLLCSKEDIPYFYFSISRSLYRFLQLYNGKSSPPDLPDLSVVKKHLTKKMLYVVML